MKVKIMLGDRIKASPLSFGDTQYSQTDNILSRKRETRTGTVVFIHPKGRFVTLEFDAQLGKGKLRESFFLDALQNS